MEEWQDELAGSVWDLIESCLDHFGGGSGSPQMSALAEAMQLVSKVFFLFLWYSLWRRGFASITKRWSRRWSIWWMYYGWCMAHLKLTRFESCLRVFVFWMCPNIWWSLCLHGPYLKHNVNNANQFCQSRLLSQNCVPAGDRSEPGYSDNWDEVPILHRFFCFLCTCSRVFECWVLVDPFISAALMNWQESPKSQPSPGLERETDCKSLEWQESISTVDPFVEYLGSLGLSLHRFLLVLPVTKFSLLRLCAGTSRSRRERHAQTLQSL